MYVLFHKTFVFARIHMFIEKLFNFSLHYLDTKICWMSEFFFLFVPYIFCLKKKYILFMSSTVMYIKKIITVFE